MKILNIYLGTYTVETDPGIWPIFSGTRAQRELLYNLNVSDYSP